ncbi:MAG: hypothetical protein ACI8QC_003902 [Planctomycetota bacterium]|jgi:hypothetical protein
MATERGMPRISIRFKILQPMAISAFCSVHPALEVVCRGGLHALYVPQDVRGSSHSDAGEHLDETATVCQIGLLHHRRAAWQNRTKEAPCEIPDNQ